MMDVAGMPHARLWSQEAEQAVLGAVFVDPSAAGVAAEAGLLADHFAQDAHRVIWQAVEAQVAAGRPTDLIMLHSALEQGGNLERVGGAEYLLEINEGVASSANVVAYAEIVKERALSRYWFTVLDRAKQVFLDAQHKDPVADAERMLASLDSGRSGAAFQAMPELVKQFVADLDDRFNNPGVRGLETGFRHIDFHLQGLNGLVVVGARPGMGKTNFLLNILRQVGKQPDAGCVLGFNLEMSNLELVRRLAAAEGKVKQGLLKSAKVLEHQDSMVRLSPALSALQAANVRLCDDPGLTVAEICSMSRAVHRRERVGLVVVDYLGLIECSSHSDRQDLKIADITRSLKRLSKELGCPVVIAAQLNREVENRKDKRPVLRDLRDSGAIEQDADVVLFLYRDEYYYPDTTQHPNQVEVIRAKVRDGETGSDYLAWHGEYALLEDKPEGSEAGQGYEY